VIAEASIIIIDPGQKIKPKIPLIFVECRSLLSRLIESLLQDLGTMVKSMGRVMRVIYTALAVVIVVCLVILWVKVGLALAIVVTCVGLLPFLIVGMLLRKRTRRLSDGN